MRPCKYCKRPTWTAEEICGRCQLTGALCTYVPVEINMPQDVVEQDKQELVDSQYCDEGGHYNFQAAVEGANV